ncbi:MAG: hypothetical protein ACM3O6_12440 [Acidobacteriota bacterium]
MFKISEQNARHRAAHPARRAMRARLSAAAYREAGLAITFKSRDGKRIERETQPGSAHEKRMLKRAARAS